MANLFKSLDTGGFISTLRDFGLAIRQFFGTKTEMDVVATALTDLDRRIDESIQSISVGTVTTGSPGSSAQVTVSGSDKDVILNFSIPRGADGTNGRDGIDGVDGENGKDGTNGRDGVDGKDGKDGVTPTISVGTVTTGSPGSSAQVTVSGSDKDVILNFSIPRGADGDMKELDDSSDYCTVWPIWQMRPNANFEFADRVLVPIPSVSTISSLADCIKQTNTLTLPIGENIIKQTYVWSELHWSKKCSRSDRIVYAAKYATPDADFPSVNHTTETDVSKKVKRPPSIIDIAVTSVKGTSGVARYVQVTIENEYGRAYYRGTV